MFPKALAHATKDDMTTLTRRDLHYDAKAVDIYAMGVCLFEMQNLTKPYPEEMNGITLDKITVQEITYHNHEVQDSCKDLIGQMLKLAPTQRPTADDVLKHRWICFGTVINAVASLAGKIFN